MIYINRNISPVWSYVPAQSSPSDSIFPIGMFEVFTEGVMDCAGANINISQGRSGQFSVLNRIFQ